MYAANIGRLPQGVPSPCGRQTLWAKSSNNWGVIATMPKGNLSVLTYPIRAAVREGGYWSCSPVSKFPVPSVVTMLFKSQSARLGSGI